ncbi:RNA polymerase factor sigma-54 [Clostridium sp. SM-530-WT-3G]|uniref:RNA polymerase factor sigma-54 n=1 Tax=Clostridium sp. SM-530-WT-3G TaxID=2725303 RepID=UPI00145DA9A9|nr:RNA polymerase factor sigma-54 [Clostridium sp. SM-530-WT-3G]NME82210.1 RNA polymerase factor sigma-54 [Clostridium sp. SM-530-WT-3G]
MDLDYNLEIKQEQKMILTQNMQQSIKLLQMSMYDLREYIDNQYSENPVLEMEESQTENDEYIKNKSIIKDFIYDIDGDVDRSEINYSKDEQVSLLNFIEKKKSLKEYLYEQLVEVDENPYKIGIAKYIIESLNSSGYLEIKTSEIAKEIKSSKFDVEEGLKIVQSLEPYGIGARNIQECLLIQSMKLNILDDIIKEMILYHLEDIAQNKYDAIARKFNISIREAQRYGDLIKKLEPKPSRGFFTGDEVNYTITDAEIKNIDGELYIIMNDSVLPRLTVNNTYKSALNDKFDMETCSYVKEKINKAVFLIKAIEQRKNTLYKVLECLINEQKEFFIKGPEYIKVLTLKDVAQKIKFHESTISRAIKDKYILTSYGTIKIKDLFLGNIKYKNNENIIPVNIKNEIKKIISMENKNKPLSDQAIADCLKEKNVQISRRTVAKYREQLGIKASSMRKRI